MKRQLVMIAIILIALVQVSTVFAAAAPERFIHPGETVLVEAGKCVIQHLDPEGQDGHGYSNPKVLTEDTSVTGSVSDGTGEAGAYVFANAEACSDWTFKYETTDHYVWYPVGTVISFVKVHDQEDGREIQIGIGETVVEECSEGMYLKTCSYIMEYDGVPFINWNDSVGIANFSIVPPVTPTPPPPTDGTEEPVPPTEGTHTPPVDGTPQPPITVTPPADQPPSQPPVYGGNCPDRGVFWDPGMLIYGHMLQDNGEPFDDQWHFKGSVSNPDPERFPGAKGVWAVPKDTETGKWEFVAVWEKHPDGSPILGEGTPRLTLIIGSGDNGVLTCDNFDKPSPSPAPQPPVSGTATPQPTAEPTAIATTPPANIDEGATRVPETPTPEVTEEVIDARPEQVVATPDIFTLVAQAASEDACPAESFCKPEELSEMTDGFTASNTFETPIDPAFCFPHKETAIPTQVRVTQIMDDETRRHIAWAQEKDHYGPSNVSCYEWVSTEILGQMHLAVEVFAPGFGFYTVADFYPDLYGNHTQTAGWWNLQVQGLKLYPGDSMEKLTDFVVAQTDVDSKHWNDMIASMGHEIEFLKNYSSEELSQLFDEQSQEAPVQVRALTVLGAMLP